jgi:peptide-methionine (S)-S-oxide reductase
MRQRLLFCVSALATGLFAASFPEPPAAQTGPAAGSGQQIVVLAGGCFWGMQGVFEHVRGVVDTTAGYAGGEKNTARYETVSTGRTGHAESVKITFDPSKISFGQLLEIYFSVAHDPTTLNRQHYDEGTQYRSSIFYTSEDQKRIAEDYIRQLDGAHVFRHSIVTQVAPLKGFYAAESYHQHYLDHNPTQPYIVNIDLPLIAALKKNFPELYVR